MKRLSWYLEDVTAAAAANPRSFFIPDESERCSLQRGDVVRLHFVLVVANEGDPRAERMWVEIESVTSGGYRGRLTNRPGFIHDLELGDQVEFGPQHVARVNIGPGHPKWLECGELDLLVSAQILDEQACAGYAYREEPDSERDSGWRVLTGHETTEFLDEPANCRRVNVAWFVDFEPSLLSVFGEAAPAEFTRTGSDAGWVRHE